MTGQKRRQIEKLLLADNKRVPEGFNMTSHLAALKRFFGDREFSLPQIALLQPADPFLDTTGEDLRRRVFMTRDLDGASLCLRPEFTIPVCLSHLESGREQGRYAYLGNVFRQRRDGPAEFLQAGMEIIGGEQRAGSRESLDKDVEVVVTALDALAHCGMKKTRVIFGDQAIFEALLVALELPDAWMARLGRAFGDSRKFESDLQLITSSGPALEGSEPELRNALKNMDLQAVTGWVAIKMANANLPSNTGRSAEDIAERMIAKAELAATQLSNEQRRILDAFLDIEVTLASAVDELHEFSKRVAIDIDDAIGTFGWRAEQLTKQADKDVTFSWRASFGRPLDYYTGIVFEIFQSGSPEPVCGGGRYDHLMNMLGAESEIPAIGFSLWIDRLPGETK